MRSRSREVASATLPRSASFLCLSLLVLLLLLLPSSIHAQPKHLKGIRRRGRPPAPPPRPPSPPSLNPAAAHLPSPSPICLPPCSVRPDQSKYTGTSFTCFDGSASLPSTSVNDDYCDCADSSDEPGTSACPASSFFCPNKGASPQTLPPSRVNDLICDCCDGSDEYAGHVQGGCPNTCAELGRSMHQHVLDEIAATDAGVQVRQRLIDEAKAQKAEKETKKATYEAKLEQRRKVLEDAKAAQAAQEALEQAEKDRLKAIEDAAAAEKAAAEAALHQDDSEFLKLSQQPEEDTTPVPADQQLEAGPAVGNTETPAAASPDVAPAENFPYPAEYAYKPDDTASPPPSPPPPAAPELVQQEIESFPYPAEYAYRADDGSHAQAADGGLVVEEEEEVAPPLMAGVVLPPAQATPEAAAAPVEAAPAAAASATFTLEAAEKAREVTRAAQAKVDRTQSKLDELNRWLTSDFGPDLEFASLSGHCFSFTQKQYTYEMCPYGDANQKEGGQSTRLGGWDGLKVREDGTRVLSFSNGQTCWNGPARSLQVLMRCGVDNVIKDVEEPSRCVYEMTFATPLVCNAEHAQQLQKQLEDQMGAEEE